MANKRITDVDIVTSLNGDESFFINQNNAIKQVNKSNVVFGVANGGTGATTVAGARKALGLGDTDGALPVANGGTGATTVAGARKALGLGNSSGALPVANGGTGATTAKKACENLGAAYLSKLTITLSSDKWSDNKQTAEANGVEEDSVVFVTPNTDSDALYSNCGITCAAQSSNALEFKCDVAPSADIVVNVAVFS